MRARQDLYYKGHALDSLKRDTRHRSSDRSQNTGTQTNTQGLGTTAMTLSRDESMLLVLKLLFSPCGHQELAISPSSACPNICLNGP